MKIYGWSGPTNEPPRRTYWIALRIFVVGFAIGILFALIVLRVLP